MHRLIRALTAAIAVLLGLGNVAFADAIDGNWCQANGQRMSIRGPAIVTPGGQQITGTYDRHFFSYVIPAGETGAGATAEIQLLSEDLAHERSRGDAPLREWRRCPPGVS